MGARLAIAAVVLCAASTARAQDVSPGVVEGKVATSEGVPLNAVIVRVTDRSGLVGIDRTDFRGNYRIQGLPPGTYRIGFSLRGTELLHGEVVIHAGAVTKLPVRGPGVLVPRVIEPMSAAMTTRIGRELLDHGVRVGFDLESMFGVAPGAQSDGLGVGFSGSDSLENRYVVDGVDVTGVVYPNLGASVPLDFVDEVEIASAGAGAHSGGFTGGLVRAITKRGGSETRGSVFATLAPGLLVADRKRAPSGGATIEAQTDTDLAMIAGGEIGGPVVKDHAWYWIGIAPRWTKATMTRRTSSRVDENQDGFADVDPETGFEIYEELDRSEHDASSGGVTLAAKLDAAVDEDQQGGIALMVTPTFQETVRPFGIVAEQRLATRRMTTDVAARWSSRFDKHRIDSVIGVHRSSYRLRSADGRDDVPLQMLSFGSLGEWSALGGESAATTAGCRDGGADDEYPDIVNCPDTGQGYAIGGPGELVDDTEQRVSAQTTWSRHSSFIGTHMFQLGVGVEDARSWTSRLYSGGREIRNSGGGVDLTRWVEVREAGAPGTVPCMDGAEIVGCDPIVVGEDAARTGQRAFAWSGFLEEVWRPISILTFELGMRRDQQYLHDTLTLPATWSPRMGFAVDPSHQGRSRIYARWGSYNERVPLSLSERLALGGALEQRTYRGVGCGPPVEGFGGPDGAACDPEDPSVIGTVSSGERRIVDPDLIAQHLDESVIGYDREVRPGVTVGVAYVRRTLQHIVEDVTDETGTLYIANPGWGLAEGLGVAYRDRRELQFRISARLSRRLLVDASYVMSTTEGNYPGLHAPDTGQVEPNLSSQFDLIETLANREGALPQDRPHYLKVDGFYSFGAVTVGGRLRALSGTPIDAMGRHYRYGTREVFLLPRGALGRTDFAYGIDLHADYERDLGDGLRLRLFVDILNATNAQDPYAVDESYTYVSNANPIVGGAYEDLIFAKERALTSGAETSTPLKRNPNFRRPTSRYAPLSLRLGARLTF